MKTKLIIALIVFSVMVCMAWYLDTKTHIAPIPTLQPTQEAITTEIWRVTAYCPCEKCCGRFSDGITASGSPAKGKLIAAPKSIPFGTWIEVEGYGYAEVLDRGGSIKGRRLDVFFPTHQEALNWGVKYINLHTEAE